MTGWLSLTDEQRRATLEQASVRSGITAKAFEKDWWVTLTLKALFSTAYRDHCIFKGGTSLSKGWKLIQRFSEDIDIALDPAAFGMEYQVTPSKSYVKKLKREGCAFTSTKIKAALEKAFDGIGIPLAVITITAEEVPEKMPDKDPQTLFVRYQSLFDPNPYLADEVKLEFGVRSLKEPFSTIPVQSLLWEYFPNPAYREEPFEVVAVEPRKTILEKAFLLHEKLVYKSPELLLTERQSRHIYDIVQNMDQEAGAAALGDKELYITLLHHRRHYGLGSTDYDNMQSWQIDFVPPVEWLEFFEKDYAEMRRSMIYGDSHEFAEMIRRLKLFNGRLRLMHIGISLEEIIEKAKQERSIDIMVNILHQDVEMTDAEGKSWKFKITFHHMKGEKVFERIEIVSDHCNRKNELRRKKENS